MGVVKQGRSCNFKMAAVAANCTDRLRKKVIPITDMMRVFKNQATGEERFTGQTKKRRWRLSHGRNNESVGAEDSSWDRFLIGSCCVSGYGALVFTSQILDKYLTKGCGQECNVSISQSKNLLIGLLKDQLIQCGKTNLFLTILVNQCCNRNRIFHETCHLL